MLLPSYILQGSICLVSVVVVIVKFKDKAFYFSCIKLSVLNFSVLNLSHDSHQPSSSWVSR